MTNERKYFCEDEHPQLIRAGLAAGTMVAWRKGIDGKQWYRKAPTICGVPPEPIRESEDYDDLLEAEADDDEEAIEAYLDGDDDQEDVDDDEFVD